ncbi:PREDICTED: uncharacterized protein LOC105567513, partial [Vollenhovia emeryi]|uniref:uncharacterized protein LOC105567513 n=1 Tax=Vollenhovia emeryi TaxID=411798 RepID=UPI0005F50651
SLNLIKFIKFKETVLSVHRFSGLLTDTRVDGLSSYNVSSADFKLIGLRANANLSWPTVVANTYYSMKGNAFGFDVYGNGKMNAIVKDLKFCINFSFTLKDKHIQVKQVVTKISLGALDFHATGLYDDEDTSKLLSDTISDMVPKMIDEYQKDVTDNVNEIIKTLANEFLSTITLKDLLKILGL